MKKSQLMENENYQRRTYALASMSLILIVFFWTFCLIAPIDNKELAGNLSIGLLAPVVMILQFFFRTSKKDAATTTSGEETK